MTIDTDEIVRILETAKKETTYLLSTAFEEGLEMIGEIFFNVLAVIGIGIISFVAFVAFVCGQVELKDIFG